MRRRKPIDVSLLYGKIVASIPSELFPSLRGLTIRTPQTRAELRGLIETNRDRGHAGPEDIEKMYRQPLIAVVTYVTKRTPTSWVADRILYYKPLFPYYDLEEKTVISPTVRRRPSLFRIGVPQSFFARILQVVRPDREEDPLARFQHI